MHEFDTEPYARQRDAAVARLAAAAGVEVQAPVAHTLYVSRGGRLLLAAWAAGGPCLACLCPGAARGRGKYLVRVCEHGWRGRGLLWAAEGAACSCS